MAPPSPPPGAPTTRGHPGPPQPPRPRGHPGPTPEPAGPAHHATTPSLPKHPGASRKYTGTTGQPRDTRGPPLPLSCCLCQPAPSMLPTTCPRSTPAPRSRQRARGDTQERRPAAVDQGPQEAHASHFPLLSCYLCCLPLSPPYTHRSNRRTPYNTRSAHLHRQARTCRNPLGRHEPPYLPGDNRETRRQATGMR